MSHKQQGGAKIEKSYSLDKDGEKSSNIMNSHAFFIYFGCKPIVIIFIEIYFYT